MSRLFGLARVASEYVRNRFQPKYRELDEAHDAAGRGRDPEWKNRLRRTLLSHFDQRSGGGAAGGDDWQEELRKKLQEGLIPPEPKKPPDDDFGPELGPGEIQLLGRDVGYHEEDFEAMMTAMRRTPGSSNVFGYFFERESRRYGILYVTFLAQSGREKTSSPGPTYAYYDVPVRKALDFQRRSAESAGGAVWDYLRIRGSRHAHQHQYRLIHVSGEYVPRKVTPRGYRTRHVPALGVGRREFRRSTLPEEIWPTMPDRGEPDRGEPDRG